MKQPLLLLLLLAFQVLSAQVFTGQEADALVPGAEVVRMNPGSDVPSYIRFRKGKEIEMEDWGLFCEKVLGMREEDGVSGHQQTYHNLPVEGARILLHTKGNLITALNGDFFSGITLPPTPQISQTQARKFAMKTVPGGVFQFGLPKGDLVIAPFQGDYSQRDFRLCWKFDVYSLRPLSRHFVFVDAKTGEIVDAINRLHSSDTEGQAITRYSGQRTITTDSIGPNLYRLRESGRGQGIETYNLQNSNVYTGAIDFWDDDNTWDNANANLDEVATDVHWATEMTYDYFDQVHGLNGLDGNGYRIRSYVHFSTGYYNAYWDGVRLVYGDGNSLYGPLTTVDVVAHEATHALTEFSASLIYRNESGALNESFSDIFGVAVDHFARPDSFNWLVGEESGNALRSMVDPNSLGSPRNYKGNDWFTGSGDNGGVHFNSGVQNHWFYLLTEGGSGTNDLGNVYAVTGIGIEKAAAVAFRTLTTYLTPISDFADARFYSIQSAIDLYGPCTPEVESVTNAWQAVGLGGTYSATVLSEFTAAPATSCSVPFEVTFDNQSFNAGTYLWDFGDGNTSTLANPSHTYQQLGTYTVTLNSSAGTCGSATETKTNYIVLDSLNPCQAYLPVIGTGLPLSDCQGTLYDDGGPNRNYGNNVLSSLVITPQGAAQVSLQFTQFDFESGYDFLYIHDGPTANSPLIGAFTGSALPMGGTITSTSSALTLVQYTDPFLTGIGFTATWSCTPVSKAPVADFFVEKTSTCSGEIYFQDLSREGTDTWLWDFGNGMTSTDPSPQHIYTTSGTYTVSLTVSNAFGTDTKTDSNLVVIDLPATPVATDVALCAFGPAMLAATGPGSLRWYGNQDNLLGEGKAFLTAPVTGPTIFKVRSQLQEATQFIGPADSAIGAGGFFDRDTRYLVFDVEKEIILESVKVFANGEGFRTFQYRDPYGRVIDQRIVFLPEGEFRVPLGFTLQPGNGYQLALAGISDLYRSQENVAFPYEIPGLLSIRTTNAPIDPLDNYYFFYNWEVREPACLSAAQSVLVTVVQESLAADFTYNQVNSAFDFMDNTPGATSWIWDFGDGKSATIQNPTHRFAAIGTYPVTLAATDSVCQALTTQTIFTDIAADLGEKEIEDDWVIFPNPGNGRVNFRFPLGHKILTVFDFTGKKVVSKVFESAVSAEMEISDLPSGTYFFRLEMVEGVYVKKYLLVR